MGNCFSLMSVANGKNSHARLSNRGRAVTQPFNFLWDTLSQMGHPFEDLRMRYKSACRQTVADPAVQAEDHLQPSGRTRLGCAKSASTHPGLSHPEPFPDSQPP